MAVTADQLVSLRQHAVQHTPARAPTMRGRAPAAASGGPAVQEQQQRALSTRCQHAVQAAVQWAHANSPIPWAHQPNPIVQPAVVRERSMPAFVRQHPQAGGNGTLQCAWAWALLHAWRRAQCNGPHAALRACVEGLLPGAGRSATALSCCMGMSWVLAARHRAQGARPRSRLAAAARTLEADLRGSRARRCTPCCPSLPLAAAPNGPSPGRTSSRATAATAGERGHPLVGALHTPTAPPPPASPRIGTRASAECCA